jgi:HAD superfamily hydrolase (TIGR01459 family)
MLDRLGVPRTAYDDIVTSGDVARELVAARPGATVHHIGPARDRPIFSALELRFGSVEAADYVVCTGLFDDETETPEHYRDLLARMRARGLLMLCANPDLVVERGDKLIYCAGAIADLYRTMGGDVIYTGKPHRPIYEQALGAVAVVRGAAPAPARVLAIGDSVRTDLKGAAGAGLDCLFITGGIHAEELARSRSAWIDLQRGGRAAESRDAAARLVTGRSRHVSVALPKFASPSGPADANLRIE